MTVEQAYPLYQLLKKDRRFPVDAYVFVREALSYASEVLELGKEEPVDPVLSLESVKTNSTQERHISGSDLCGALRQFALHQFGYMAQVVLKDWGIESTSDFGEIVYNMISVGMMKKSKDDQRDHFDDVYDFEVEFQQNFQFCHRTLDRHC